MDPRNCSPRTIVGGSNSCVARRNDSNHGITLVAARLVQFNTTPRMPSLLFSEKIHENKLSCKEEEILNMIVDEAIAIGDVNDMIDRDEDQRQQEKTKRELHEPLPIKEDDQGKNCIQVVGNYPLGIPDDNLLNLYNNKDQEFKNILSSLLHLSQEQILVEENLSSSSLSAIAKNSHGNHAKHDEVAVIATFSPENDSQQNRYDCDNKQAATLTSTDATPNTSSAAMVAATTVTTAMPPLKQSGGGVLAVNEYQDHRWNRLFGELLEFRQEHGHTMVPLKYTKRRSLALWVKRQRHQYVRKMNGQNSTLDDRRQQELEKVGFVWGAHEATWETRMNQLTEFKEKTGHCNVPSIFPENPKLSMWVKSQRRQCKLWQKKKPTPITDERVYRLKVIGFDWNPRKLK